MCFAGRDGGYLIPSQTCNFPSYLDFLLCSFLDCGAITECLLDVPYHRDKTRSNVVSNRSSVKRNAGARQLNA